MIWAISLTGSMFYGVIQDGVCALYIGERHHGSGTTWVYFLYILCRRVTVALWGGLEDDSWQSWVGTWWLGHRVWRSTVTGGGGSWRPPLLLWSRSSLKIDLWWDRSDCAVVRGRGVELTGEQPGTSDVGSLWRSPLQVQSLQEYSYWMWHSEWEDI